MRRREQTFGAKSRNRTRLLRDSMSSGTFWHGNGVGDATADALEFHVETVGVDGSRSFQIQWNSMNLWTFPSFIHLNCESLSLKSRDFGLRRRQSVRRESIDGWRMQISRCHGGDRNAQDETSANLEMWSAKTGDALLMWWQHPVDPDASFLIRQSSRTASEDPVPRSTRTSGGQLWRASICSEIEIRLWNWAPSDHHFVL